MKLNKLLWSFQNFALVENDTFTILKNYFENYFLSYFKVKVTWGYFYFYFIKVTFMSYFYFSQFTFTLKTSYFGQP